MSFFGKKYKKVDIENIVQLLDALDVSEKVRSLLKKVESLTSFVQNGDGTIQYIVEVDDEKLLDQKVTLGEEGEFTTPDGAVTKNLFKLEGETLRQTMTKPDGSAIYFDRIFDGDSMRMEIWADSTDVKGAVIYAAV